MTNIVMKLLDTRAAIMTRACKEGSVNAGNATMNFFKYANENNLPNQALIAYYNQVNRLKGYSPNQFAKDILTLSANDKSLGLELTRFEKMVNDNYPRTAGDRISVLSNGAVVPDRVKPQNFFVKLFATINKCIREVEE